MMDSEIQIWLDEAVTGLPSELQKPIRDELISHYLDAVAGYIERGKTQEESHQLVMVDLGNPSITAQELRKTHLHPRWHLLGVLAMGVSCLWVLINGGNIFPADAFRSGGNRIIISMMVFLVYFAGLWILRRLLTKELRLKALKRPIDLQLLGWSLPVIPFATSVFIAKAQPIVRYVTVEYNGGDNFYSYLIQALISYPFTQILTFITFGLIGIGTLMMAYRIAKLNPMLYGLKAAMMVITLIYGLSIGFKTAMVAAITFQIFLSPRWQIALLILSQVIWFAMLVVVFMLFLSAYRHDSTWASSHS